MPEWWRVRGRRRPRRRWQRHGPTGGRQGYCRSGAVWTGAGRAPLEPVRRRGEIRAGYSVLSCEFVALVFEVLNRGDELPAVRGIDRETVEVLERGSDGGDRALESETSLTGLTG